MDPIFIIYTPGSRRYTGGHVVLHVLAKRLAESGFEVWTTAEPMYPCKVSVLEKKEEEGYILGELENKLDRVVAVYPEQIEGNPLGTKHVARWILYYTKKEIELTWSKTDEIYFLTYGFSKKMSIKLKDYKRLETFDFKHDIFFNKGYGAKRQGYCYLRKKGFPEEEKLISETGATDLTSFTEKGFEYLAEEFNKHEYYLSYDHATFYITAAAMCGCRVVIVNPDPTLTPEEFRVQFPTQKYGVAYGWMDLKHADMTRDMVIPYTRELAKMQEKLLRKFVENWRLKIS